MKITISTDDRIVMDVIEVRDGSRPDSELEDWDCLFSDELDDIAKDVREAFRVAVLNA